MVLDVCASYKCRPTLVDLGWPCVWISHTPTTLEKGSMINKLITTRGSRFRPVTRVVGMGDSWTSPTTLLLPQVYISISSVPCFLLFGYHAPHQGSRPIVAPWQQKESMFAWGIPSLYGILLLVVRNAHWMQCKCSFAQSLRCM